VPLTPTLEGIPLNRYENIIKLEITATADATHTITTTCANDTKPKVIVEADMLKELLLVNHRSRSTNFANGTEQILSRDVIAELINSRQYPAFHQEAHDIEIAIEAMGDHPTPYFSH
jgi:hypothetical protein